MVDDRLGFEPGRGRGKMVNNERGQDMKLLIVASLVLLLTACDYRYRYPCQNVENWNDTQCKQPLCEVHQECPHHVLGTDSQPLVDQYQRGQQGKTK